MIGRFFRSRTVVLVLLLGWMGVIFLFSSLSGKQTVGPPPLWYFIERKGAHVFEYALLTLLSFRYLLLSYRSESYNKILVVAALFSLMYGATDELHQFFVPLRGARFSDVLIDGLGVLFMSLILFLWYKNKNRS